MPAPLRHGVYMSIKSILQRVLPSYRASAKTNDMINDISYQFVDQKGLVPAIKSRIEDLDKKIEYLFFLTQRLPQETEIETRKRVLSNLPKSNGTFRYVQMAVNELLQRIKKYADEINVDIFLFYGTALGAVRHKGFIPWDDDIDIGMFQDDYLRLKQVIDADDFICVNRYYIANGSSVVKVKYRFSDNFFVDIFIMDMIRVDESQIEEYWLRSQEYTKRYSELVIKKLEQAGLLETASRLPVYDPEIDRYATELAQGFRFESGSVHTNEAYVVESIADGYAFRDRMYYCKSDVYLPILKDEVVFEGESYSVLHNNSDYLSFLYGDIWRFPRDVTCQHFNEFNEHLSDDIQRLIEMKIIGESS